jgi:CP family cyanate transporter-like MFS transporter
MKIDVTPRSVKVSYSVVAFFLLAANLRPALTSVGPVLEAIRSSLGLPAAAAGLLTALPLLVFAGASPLASLGQVFGMERTLAGCLALTATGIAVRSLGSVTALFGGTLIFAIGIGVANVLVPSLIKRDFPRQVAGMTTAYVMVMSLTGAVATGLAVPLSAHLSGGWRSSLAVWGAFAAFALLCWLPEGRQARVAIATPKSNSAVSAKAIWRSALAWQVTVFMGLQFLIYYVTIGWIPLYLAERGESPTQAGWLLMLYQIVAFAAGFVAPMLMRLGGDQRTLAVLGSSVTALSTVGLLVAPSLAGLWLCILGVSFGITFILAFALIGMRTRDHQRAAALSTLSQACAYLIAAIGPVAFGWLRDATSSWAVPMVSLAAVSLIQALAGFGAGREGQV